MKFAVRAALAAALLSLFLFFRTGTASGITSANPLGITVGVHIPPSRDYPWAQQIETFNLLTGKNSGIVMYFSDWSGAGTKAFDENLLTNQIETMPSSSRPVVMITWQPMNAKQILGCDQDYSKGVPLDAIIAGKCDPYIREYASEVSIHPERIIIRFAHEMNTTDYPWSGANNGDNPAKYVAMFRHVHDVFMGEVAALGRKNIEWMWSPNYASNPPDSWNAIQNYYPGDAYVDWIGLSGFNWYTSGGMQWLTFNDLFGSDGHPNGVLANLACRFAKPVIISETGSVSGSPTYSKDAWITNGYQDVQNYPFVRGLVWFDDYAYDNPDAADFRITQINPINPLPTFTQTYKTAVSAQVFTSSLPSVQAATPPFTYCQGTQLPIFTLNPTVQLVEPGQSSTFILKGMTYTGPQSISVNPSGTGITYQVSPPSISAPWGESVITINTSPSTNLGLHLVTVGVGSVTFQLQIEVLKDVYHSYEPAIAR